MLIVNFDGAPSWYLDANETGEGTKCPCVGVVESPPLHPYAINSTASTHGHFVLSPVSLASRDQDDGPSNPTIDISDLTEKYGMVNSLKAGLPPALSCRY